MVEKRDGICGSLSTLQCELPKKIILSIFIRRNFRPPEGCSGVIKLAIVFRIALIEI